MFFNHKKLWIIAFISLLIAGGAFAFLPDTVPIHFNGEGIDGYAGKSVIFGFPLLELLLVWISGRDSFQYWCMHGKTVPKTEMQYDLILFCVLALITIIEAAIILLSF